MWSFLNPSSSIMSPFLFLTLKSTFSSFHNGSVGFTPFLTNVTPSRVPLFLFTVIKTLPPLIPASVRSDRVSKLCLVGFYFLLFASWSTIHHRFLPLDTFTLPFSSDLYTFHRISPFPLNPSFTPSLTPLLSFSLLSSLILTASLLPPLSSSFLTCLGSTYFDLHFSRCHHDHRRRVRDGDRAWSTALGSKSPADLPLHLNSLI